MLTTLHLYGVICKVKLSPDRKPAIPGHELLKTWSWYENLRFLPIVFQAALGNKGHGKIKTNIFRFRHKHFSSIAVLCPLLLKTPWGRPCIDWSQHWRTLKSF